MDDCVCKVSLRTNIWTAAHYGDGDRVRHLLEHHSSSSSKSDEYGHTALHFAAHAGHVDVVRLLLERGADVNASACGCTALHRSAYAGHIAVVRLLLYRSVTAIDARDMSIGDQRTPLMKAASQGHTAVVRALLDAGASITATDSHGRTAHEIAAAGGHVELGSELARLHASALQRAPGGPSTVAVAESSAAGGTCH